VLFQQERQRHADALFVIDEKNAGTLPGLAGAGIDLESDALGFAQDKLPMPMRLSLGCAGTYKNAPMVKY
jgi:hypothetical protein